MWKCPVCETEYGDVTVCPKCGFDGSCDYERYPTAFTVRNAKSTRALRREGEQKQAPRGDGGNINREIVITPEQAAQGCQITAGYFGGKRVEVTIPANWKDGGLLRCAEQGYPGKNGGKNGDLILTVRVQQPEPAQRRETAQDSLNDALGDLTVALHNVQQAKQAQQQAQTQQQAQQPKQAQPAPAKAPAAKKSSGLKSHPILVILVILAVFYLFNVYSLVSCKTYGSTVQLRIELSSIAPIRARQLARAESLMETHSFTKIIILGGHADEELMNWLLQQERITKITSLTLIKGKLNDLTPLVDLTQLESLCISNNQISDLTPLAGLTQLRNLDVADNQISDLTPLAGLTQLRDLDIGDNQISDLTPLAGLTELQSLRMENNQIRSLAGLENLTALYAIYAAGNPLTDTSALEVSGCMSALRTD